MVPFHRIEFLPPYVFAQVDEWRDAERKQGADVVDLSLGNPDQDTPPIIVKTLIEEATKPSRHRYQASHGIAEVRQEIASHYARQYNVELNPETEVAGSIGSKEALAHLILSMVGPADNVMIPDPCYPLHRYGVHIAGGFPVPIPVVSDGTQYFKNIVQTWEQTWPRPKLLILNFPHNPTAAIAPEGLFEQVVDFARKRNLWVIHDMAYADICFDGYRAPSFLAVPGARDIAVETFSMSKSFNMPGWRVGFLLGNTHLVQALRRIKAHMDYGSFRPIQMAAITALRHHQELVPPIARLYQDRRDALIPQLNKLGWPVPMPKASMFAWAPIPRKYEHLTSFEFAKKMIQECHVAMAPGGGFGPSADKFMRIAFVEDTGRLTLAAERLGKLF